MEKIIFKNKDNTIGIITPTPEALQRYTIEAIAQKDTPHGLPYWIVDKSEIPNDREFRGAWEVDEDAIGSAHGVGSVINSF